jgi:hypothetical protein
MQESWRQGHTGARIFLSVFFLSLAAEIDCRYRKILNYVGLNNSNASLLASIIHKFLPPRHQVTKNIALMPAVCKKLSFF